MLASAPSRIAQRGIVHCASHFESEVGVGWGAARARFMRHHKRGWLDPVATQPAPLSLSLFLSLFLSVSLSLSLSLSLWKFRRGINLC